MYSQSSTSNISSKAKAIKIILYSYPMCWCNQRLQRLSVLIKLGELGRKLSNQSRKSNRYEK